MNSGRHFYLKDQSFVFTHNNRTVGSKEILQKSRSESNDHTSVEKKLIKRRPIVKDLQKLQNPPSNQEESAQLYFVQPNQQLLIRKSHNYSPLQRQPISESLKYLSKKTFDFKEKKKDHYESLFDRHSVTLDATFTKDLDNQRINLPVNRIGYFMQDSQKLKQQHLLALNTQIHSINLCEQTTKPPILLCFPDGRTNHISQSRLTFNASDYKIETVSVSLYPEFISGYEDCANYKAQTISYLKKLFRAMKNTYDPTVIPYMKAEHDIRKWPTCSQQAYTDSIKVYWTYCDDLLWDNEQLLIIPEKQLMRSLSMVNFNDNSLRKQIIAEVSTLYKQSIKRAILNYILNSEKERQRLQITFIPKNYPTSGERILSKGGYNRNIYFNWYQSVQKAKLFCETSLGYIYTPIQRALLDWSVQLKQFSPFDINYVDKIAQFGFCLSVLDYYQVQNIHIYLNMAWIHQIWYRGCLSIIKQYKYLIPEGKDNLTWFHQEALKKRRFLKTLVQMGEASKLFEYSGDAWFYCLNSGQILDIGGKSSEHNLKNINQEGNWKDLPSAFRETMLQNIQIMIKLQLQKVYKRTIKNYEKFFKKYYQVKELPKAAYLKSLQQIQESQLITTAMKYEKSRSSSNIPYDPSKPDYPTTQDSIRIQGMVEIRKDLEIKFDFPDDDCQPIMELKLVIKDSYIEFDYSDDEVKAFLEHLITKSLSLFDSFYNPQVARLIKEKDQVQPHSNLHDTIRATLNQQQPDFQVMFQNLSSDYKNYCSSLQFEGKQPNHYKIQLQVNNEDIKKQLQQWDDKQYIKITTPNSLIKQMHKTINENYREALLVQTLFYDLRQIISGEVQNEIKCFVKQSTVTNIEFKFYLDYLLQIESLNQQLPDRISFTFFRVIMTEAKIYISKQLDECRKIICDYYVQQLSNFALNLIERYNIIYLQMKKQSYSVEEAVAMDKFMHDIDYEIINLKQGSFLYFQNIVFYLRLDLIVNTTLTTQTEQIYSWPAIISRDLPIHEEKRNVERNHIVRQVANRRVSVTQKIDQLQLLSCQYKNFTEYSRHTKLNSIYMVRYLLQMDDYMKQLYSAEKEMQEISLCESSLNLGILIDDNIDQLIRDMQPYYEMWKSVCKIFSFIVASFMEIKKQIMTEPITKLNPHNIQGNLKQYQKTTLTLWNNFKPDTFAFKVITEFKDDLQHINKLLPIVEMLTKQGMENRHWEGIEQLLNISFDPALITVKELLRFRVEQFADLIEEISDGAQKEYVLENAIVKMENEWEDMIFLLGKWKNRDIVVFQGSNLEDIQLLLDDHTIKAQMIGSNPNVQFMEVKAKQWETMMLYIQEVLEIWVKVQAMYVYLEPIFKYEDINKSLQQESLKFQIVNKLWVKSMDQIQADPHVLKVYEIPNILNDLKESLGIMEQISKALEHHLEIKRTEFPRFFFLSNDELISTLAEARDPVNIQQHLKKCFEGIDSFIFGQKESEIIGIRSKDKEEIRFLEKINVKEFRSSLEKWLQKVDDNTKKSLVKAFDACLNDLTALNTKKNLRRRDWIFQHPGQAVMCIGTVYWTNKVETTIKTNPQEMKKYLDELQTQIEEIVILVRGQLNDLQRVILGSQIVIEVHQKDIVEQLYLENITSEFDFNWQSHMRYYYQPENKSVNVKMMQAKQDYGYEYLGTITRLVQTPLTDRCYRTMMQAIFMNLGGAPEGPAGTGKTESIKDLSKSVAVQCIVFNCSEGLNVLSMSNFFKGLASGGSWSCFDEFNRIDVEVLSVIASQILTIQQAKEQKKSSFQFEGTQLQFSVNCNIFITMNPGYAGRSELPDNLKALFRPCAMMVPDFILITEISLYSFGFLHAKYLAKKYQILYFIKRIVSVYNLCKQQLSQQGHYDYGMRAVKAALIAAQLLKQKQPDSQQEEQIVLKAIYDKINVPKFIQEDQFLFNGIIQDLFPDTEINVKQDERMMDILRDITYNKGLQMVQKQLDKVYFLWEMMASRHGIMLVGGTMSGKTTTSYLLIDCLNLLTKKSIINNKRQPESQLFIINPKAMTLNNLFGKLDQLTKEWTEGVLGEVFRKCASITSNDKQLILLDGPVDAFWIENLNTVLDDNKKLCLLNGDVIDMSPYMCMLFEVPDLHNASQATISRCGMIYYPQDSLGWEPIFESFQEQTRDLIDSVLQSRMKDLFEFFVEQVLKFVQEKCFIQQQIPDLAMIQFLLRFLKSNYDRNISQNVFSQTEQINRLDGLFIFALYQTSSCCLDQPGRKQLELFFRKLIREPNVKSLNQLTSDSTLNLHPGTKQVYSNLVRIDKTIWPPDGQGQSLQDLYFNQYEGQWKNWKDQLEAHKITEYSTQMFFIETSETLRLRSIISKIIDQKQPILLIGSTGTGKTLFLSNFLSSLDPEKQLVIKVIFSYQTQTQLIQETVEAKIERKRKGIYGPPKFDQQCQIFVDDMNVPAKDIYGDQPPIELLRHFCDYKGWYAKDRKFIEIVETNLIGAISPPGGGRNTISARLIRHFNIYSITEPDNKNFVHIFQQIMYSYSNLNYDRPDVNKELKQAFNLTIEATYELYNQMLTTLKPTPAKCHYLFNLRNVTKIYQGIQLAPPHIFVGNYRMIYKLWVNETCRVFFDKLHSNEDDQHWFVSTLEMIVKSKLRDDLKSLIYLGQQPRRIQLFEALRENIFMDIFTTTHESSLYLEQRDFKIIIQQAERCLEDYNQTSKQPMDLILFEFAIDHLLHILRIIKMPQGHALLVGLGGSGRSSLAKLAVGIRNYQLMQIEITKNYDLQNWNEDMKKLIMTAGVEKKKITFLMSDFQIKHCYVLENINSLLNIGEIPGLFTSDDVLLVADQIKLNAKKQNKIFSSTNPTSQELYEYMIETSINFLHIVVALSPIGDQFRNRIRIYPNIVNCTTIDWYKQWPEEALMTVAQKFIGQLYIDKSISVQQLTNFCIYIHQSCIQLSQRYLQYEGRYNYVTANSYLELMKLFKTYLHTTQSKLQDNRNIYTNGVSKLYSTQKQVKLMGEELLEKKEKLMILNLETQKIADVIQLQADAMEPKKIKIEVEEQLVNKRVREAEIMSIECEKELSIAKPKLKQAQDALNTLDSNDINNIKVMLKPPETVRLVMEAICILCQVPPVMVLVGKSQKTPSYWEASKKFISEKDFLKQLINFDKDNIPDNVISKIRLSYTSNVTIFNVKRVEKASSAAKGLCEWILALDEYDKVLKMVRPKQSRYNEAKMEVAELQASLRKTRDELVILNNEIGVLQKNHQEIKVKQQELQNEIYDCEQKVLRASSLINQLNSEQVRWEYMMKKLFDKLQFVVGDTLMSSAIIAYLGPFSVQYRNKQINQWIEHIRKLQISTIMVSQNYSLESTLGDQFLIRKWTMNGLPLDSFSTENAIITYFSQRWPLLIDPQGQANKWIKSNEQENKIISINQNESDFVKLLENAIQFGQAVVIENVEQNIDSSLDPLLLKQIFRIQGIISIKIGDSIIAYSKYFKLFLTSKMRNPHFPPEVTTKVTLVNFTITNESLEAQLLELCVKKERPELEETRLRLVIKKHENERLLENIEQQILLILNQAENILNDENAIETLNKSKQVANEIEEENRNFLQTQRRIDEARIVYKTIAINSSDLFFCTIGMSLQEPMYQFSLRWFIHIYEESFERSEPMSLLPQRLQNILSVLTKSLYKNVCRALFEKHKLLFSLLVTLRVMEGKNLINAQELKYLTNNIVIDKDEEKQLIDASLQKPDFLSYSQFLRTLHLSTISQSFLLLQDSFIVNKDQWINVMLSQDSFFTPFPGPYGSFTSLQKLCVIKALKQETLLQSIVEFIRLEMGEEFTTPPLFSLQASYNDSSAKTPMIFVLPGNDPLITLQTFSDHKRIELKILSLGQGQGKKAEKAIEEARIKGHWVLLQNCHLFPSWMPNLEKLSDEIDQCTKPEMLHTSFRLWLTSYPTPQFPQSILERGVKMTNEAPKGVKANLLMSFNGEKISDPNFFELSMKPKEFKSLLFGLCLFHAVLQERSTYGFLGFNCMYNFTQSDLRISIQQLDHFIREYNEIPLSSLQYLVTECNYGGRVTDEKDRRVINAVISDYFSQEILQPGFQFGNQGGFFVPDVGPHLSYVRFISNLNMDLGSELLGFHQNADIAKDIKDVEELFQNFVAVNISETATNLNQDQDLNQKQKNSDSIIRLQIAEILTKLPKLFDVVSITKRYPNDYNQTMNSVLISEIQRYNVLVNHINVSLKEVDYVLRGLAAFNEQSENVFRSLQNNLLPESWKKISYSTLKPLGSYIFDLQKRLTYFGSWCDNGEPTTHWISGYFFTQALLIAILQNSARKNKQQVDKLGWDFEFWSESKVKDAWPRYLAQNGSFQGTLIYGLFFEGAKWDYEEKCLEEQDKQQLLTSAPYILLLPTESKNITLQYDCPVFKTLERRGSSQVASAFKYIFDIRIPTKKSPSHWIKRGTALICQLND